jgi:hypothetical protein
MPLFLLASTTLAAITFCYVLLCAASPFGQCRKCNGMGFALTTDRKGRPKRGKHCRRCNGHGIRIRTGRHLYHLATRIHADGTRTTPTVPAPKENTPWS